MQEQHPPGFYLHGLNSQSISAIIANQSQVDESGHNLAAEGRRLFNMFSLQEDYETAEAKERHRERIPAELSAIHSNESQSRKP